MIESISVDWRTGWGNSPVILVAGDMPSGDAWTAQYVRREKFYRSDQGDWVRYFTRADDESKRHGGIFVKGVLANGAQFEWNHCWSSRAACINSMWPEDPVVDVIVNDLYASSVRARALVKAWRRLRPDFGLAVVDAHDRGHIIAPTRNGLVKNPKYQSVVLHLEPTGNSFPAAPDDWR